MLYFCLFGLTKGDDLKRTYYYFSFWSYLSSDIHNFGILITTIHNYYILLRIIPFKIEEDSEISLI